jgi:hypothetical protein
MLVLSDVIELNKLEKEQLIQLCETLYTLLQCREVTVNVQSTPFTFNPYLPNLTLPTYPSYQTPSPSGGSQVDQPSWGAQVGGLAGRI